MELDSSLVSVELQYEIVSDCELLTPIYGKDRLVELHPQRQDFSFGQMLNSLGNDSYADVNVYFETNLWDKTPYSGAGMELVAKISLYGDLKSVSEYIKDVAKSHYGLPEKIKENDNEHFILYYVQSLKKNVVVNTERETVDEHLDKITNTYDFLDK